MATVDFFRASQNEWVIMNESYTIRSSIKSAFKRRILFRGTLLAAIGLAPLIYAGTYVPPQTLKIWGLPLLLFAIFCLTLGLLPYRLLLKVENTPNKLQISSDETLSFITKEKKLFSIPFIAIDSCDYKENELYGIGIQMKKNQTNKIVVHDTNFDLDAFINGSQKRFHCDLFFPYFTEKSIANLKSYLNP